MWLSSHQSNQVYVGISQVFQDELNNTDIARSGFKFQKCNKNFVKWAHWVLRTVVYWTKFVISLGEYIVLVQNSGYMIFVADCIRESLLPFNSDNNVSQQCQDVSHVFDAMFQAIPKYYYCDQV